MRFYTASREMSLPTNEDTVLDDAEIVNAAPDTTHKNYDRFSEAVPEGTRFASDYVGVEVVRRRGQPRLAVPYHPALEPLGRIDSKGGSKKGGRTKSQMEARGDPCCFDGGCNHDATVPWVGNRHLTVHHGKVLNHWKNV